MTPLIYMPDIEQTVCTYLRTQLGVLGYTTDLTVAHFYDASTARAVWVQDNGGPMLDVVRGTTRIGVNCFTAGPTDEKVSLLARTVSALLRAMPDGAPVIRVVETSTPQPIAEANTWRRYATYEITTRGAQQ